MQLSDNEFLNVCRFFSEQAVELALLRRDMEAKGFQPAQGAPQGDGGRICLDMEAVCNTFRQLKGNPELASFLFFALFRMSGNSIPTDMMKRIAEAASLETLPVSLSAGGDMNVNLNGGNFNNIHDNNNVNT